MTWWLDILFPPRADDVALRDVSSDTFLALLAPHLVPITEPGTVALFPFPDTAVRAAIHEAKYHGSAQAFNFLAAGLAEYLREADDITYRKSTTHLVPVPLGKKRYRERGFNQIEEIVKLAVKGFDITIDTTLLERTRETASQVSLPRHKREENMRSAFRATRRADTSHTYIVIDDVITTGATLQAAIDALKEAGATHIVPLALAH